MTISVLDVNDHAPIFSLDEYNLTIVENLPKDFEILRLGADDADEVWKS